MKQIFPKRFAGKVMIITGAARGIGAATALRAAAEGAKLVLADRLEEEGKKTLAEVRRITDTAVFLPLDLSCEENAEKMVEECVRQFGRLDIAINNAGVMGEPAPAAELAREKMEYTMANNFYSAFFCCKYELRQFMAQEDGGVIVNNASIACGVQACRERPDQKFGARLCTLRNPRQFGEPGRHGNANGGRGICVCDGKTKGSAGGGHEPGGGAVHGGTKDGIHAQAGRGRGGAGGVYFVPCLGRRDAHDGQYRRHGRRLDVVLTERQHRKNAVPCTGGRHFPFAEPNQATACTIRSRTTSPVRKMLHSRPSTMLA